MLFLQHQHQMDILIFASPASTTQDCKQFMLCQKSFFFFAKQQYYWDMNKIWYIFGDGCCSSYRLWVVHEIHPKADDTTRIFFCRITRQQWLLFYSTHWKYCVVYFFYLEMVKKKRFGLQCKVVMLDFCHFLCK